MQRKSLRDAMRDVTEIYLKDVNPKPETAWQKVTSFFSHGGEDGRKVANRYMHQVINNPSILDRHLLKEAADDINGVVRIDPKDAKKTYKRLGTSRDYKDMLVAVCCQELNIPEDVVREKAEDLERVRAKAALMAGGFYTRDIESAMKEIRVQMLQEHQVAIDFMSHAEDSQPTQEPVKQNGPGRNG